MRKLRTPIPVAILRRHGDLRAQCNNATRCLSTVAMLNRYKKIKMYVTEPDIEEISDGIRSVRDNQQVDQLCLQLKDFDSVTEAF